MTILGWFGAVGMLPIRSGFDPSKGSEVTDTPLEQVVRLLDGACGASSVAVEAIQRWGLASLLSGTPTTLAEVSHKSGVQIDELRAAVDGLEAVGRIEIEESRIVGVGGLTLNSTNHTLALPEATMHTWCALDAVGIPAALDLDADLSTRCPHCGAQIHVIFKAGVPDGSKALRLFCPTSPCADVRAEFCSAANLFCDTDHLGRWADAHPTEGKNLELDETAELGRLMWATHRSFTNDSQLK